MNEQMKQLYELVLPSAPYVIAAYAILWASLVVYIGLTFRRLTRLEREMDVLEEAVARRAGA